MALRAAGRRRRDRRPAPPVLIAAGVFFLLEAMNPLLGLAWNIAVLYLLMGFRRFSHAFSGIAAALKTGDITGARRWLAGWRRRERGAVERRRGEARDRARPHRLLPAGVRGVVLVHHIAGPYGRRTVPGRLVARRRMARRRTGTEVTPIARARRLSAPARRLLWLLDWVPVRLTALSFAIVGDFEDAVYCWRTQAKGWAVQEGGEHAGIVLASGGGALGVALGGALPVPGGEPEYRPDLGIGEEADADLLPSAVGLYGAR
jgi:cobalamin biosynthesis protein CobD/CbiB